MRIGFCLHGSVRKSVKRAAEMERLGYEALFFASSHLCLL